jgi:8-oxo-dGTP pyrophosphatase MutT (NUDIX family)
LLEFQSDPVQDVTITGYVLNEEQTKLLMIYHERLDQWLPATGRLRDSEQPHEAAIREVLEGTGMAATPLDTQPYATTPHHHIYVLEADEAGVSPYELEERFDAQWLSRDEVLACRTISADAQAFARLNLRTVQVALPR